MNNYKVYISANENSNAFDSVTASSQSGAMGKAKKTYRKNQKDLVFWCVYVHENGQEEKIG